MRQKLPIGVDDFREIRELGLEYVDKSQLVCDLLDLDARVVLAPRPRRFGKTVNLSMLRWFFERRDEDLSGLFEGLRVWDAGESYREHFQRYPVVSLSLKGTRHDTFEGCWEALRAKIEGVFHEHRALLARGQLSEWEERSFRAILDGTANRAGYERSLLDLCAYLRRAHGERVVLLIDEYDEPIHAGYTHGYAPQILGFCRNFLTEALKGNPHLFKAALTGILRVARESIFSGLNNVAVYSLLRPELNTCFGFTEPEVEALLTRAGEQARLDDVRAWYNGYLFGGQVVYNPWSILSFLSSADKRLRGYWVATSANELIKDLLQRHALRLEEPLRALIEGGSIERRLDEDVALSDLAHSEQALWSLLVFTGYLRAEEALGPKGQEPWRLAIPNREVHEVYTSTFRQWLEERLARHGGGVERLRAALLRGDAEGLERQLQVFVTDLLSFHDPGTIEPERVYHAFILGLLGALEPDHQVRSNRESGRGRPDVLIRPVQPGQPGVVLELKVAGPGRTPEQALEEGLEQIRDRDYAAELRAAGAAPVHAFAVAFDGKQVRVRGEPARLTPRAAPP
ncbi:AAA family ATPase [Sorangium sp. So ce1389]|uniref:AAA family ATPase n=1 Tax=Sorangium sp. So ce1389 TaxID=3133336 RepID=UPI003F6013F2